MKPASEFWRRKQSPDGLALYCRECFGLRNAAKYRKQQAAIGKEARAYRRHSAVPEGMKYCAHRAETKPLAEFGSNRADPRRSRRHYRLVERYGIGEDDVDRLIERQHGLCPICRKADPHR